MFNSVDKSTVLSFATRARAWANGALLAAVAAAPLLASARVLPSFEATRVADELPRAFAAQRGPGISLAQATAMAQSRYHGKVVRAETVSQGGRVVHEIRILGEDGRVRTVRVDAQSGSIF